MFEKVNVFTVDQVKEYMAANNIIAEFSLIKKSDGTVTIKVVGSNGEIVKMLVEAAQEDKTINDLLMYSFVLG